MTRYRARVAAGARRRGARWPAARRCSTPRRSWCPASSSCWSPGSARASPSTGSISTGDLVAFYGYAAFLVTPLRTLHRGGGQGDPCAGRRAPGDRAAVVEPLLADPARRRRAAGVPLHDARSGLLVRPGAADRAGRADPAARPRWPSGSAATSTRRGRLGGVAAGDLPLAEVRRRVLVVDQSPCCSAARCARSSAVRRPGRCGARGRLRRRRPRGAAGRARHRARGARPPAVRRPAAAPACSPARSPPSRRCWSWTSPPAPSTRTPRPASPTGCATRARAAPRSC